MEKMNIGLDIDGVIYRWHESLYRYFCEIKGFDGTIYDFWLKFVPSKPNEYWDYYASLPFLYWDTTPRDDVLVTLPKLAELGTLYYITSRPDEVRYKTEKFFDYYDLPFKENIIFSRDKQTYARLLKLDYFVDDLQNNVDEVSKVTKTFLFRATHNFPIQDKYPTVGTLNEFYHIIRQEIIEKELGF
jgi:uncharacterized HAD superfamily protein